MRGFGLGLLGMLAVIIVLINLTPEAESANNQHGMTSLDGDEPFSTSVFRAKRASPPSSAAALCAYRQYCPYCNKCPCKDHPMCKYCNKCSLCQFAKKCDNLNKKKG
ncbi:hypothetical protein DdX_20355 [Ditylenchus destructor]|uniref:Agouti domain-containing protein n=1 Tax=Ditylenchus destructor TaxID=166010 RepID=A0AAD4MI67_9BILA|nr:hypothetical protein DdX_20355 [Ditylenchus destructor]